VIVSVRKLWVGVVAALVCLLPGAGWADASELKPIAVWGRFGGGDGELIHPTGVAVDPGGRFVYVADTLNNRVQKFTADGRFVATWARRFGMPTGIAVAPGGDVYVAEVLTGRIQELTPDGRFVRAFGSTGAGPGQLLLPDLLAVADDGTVLSADWGNSRVQRFSPDGRFLDAFGGIGLGPGQYLGGPHGVAVDGAGDIYTTDPDLNRVQKLSRTGVLVRAWGAPGAGDGQFRAVHGIAVGPTGDVYTTELLGNRIQRFTAGGRFVARYGRNGGDGSAGAAAGEFSLPESVAVDCRGFLYVADSNNNRIQKLRVRGVALRDCDEQANDAPGLLPKIRVAGVPRRCARSSFRVTIRVRARGRARVADLRIRVDAATIARVAGARATVIVRPARLRRGRHALRVTAIDTAGRRRSRILRFRVCRAAWRAER
jgi:DNA-binding beta-propeller fold protein YncE